jgi:hypothetical protein|tara:strand:+ start:2549 stop:4366 length:1818 start_codon:yes stop_codon:yes gene_type:complete
MPFEFIDGLWALAAIVPFIILYLRRPRPVSKTIPSLMFLLKQKRVSKQYAFMRKLMQNLLFFLQLLIILAMAFAVAQPFINLQHSVTAENTVIVLDISASMQTKDDSTTRFQKAMKEAKKYISGKVSIILAENAPLSILEDGESEVAVDLLGQVRPKATATNLGDSMILAKDILKGRPGRVVVVSDFGYSDGIDVLVAKRILTSNEIDVFLIDVSGEAKNAGIIDLKVDKYKTKVYVKNFNENEETVTIELKGEKVGKSDPIKILSNSIESFEFGTSPGISMITIDTKDDFELDNTAYVSTPLREKIKVLLVTDDKNNKIVPALEASMDIELESKYFTPERSLLADYDVIILNNFQYVPGTFEDLSYYADNGGNVIISAQDNMAEMRLADLGMIEASEVVENNVQVCVDVFNQFTRYFEKDRCFAAVSKYIMATAEDDALVIASTSDGNPLITLKEIGEGSAVYYGIYNDYSDFWQLPAYPIFWDSLIDFLVKTEDISDYNFKSGKIVSIEKQKVKTPSTTLQTAGLIMDEAGIYEFDNKKIAVNLLDEKESDVSKDKEFEEETRMFNVKSEDRKQKFNFDVPLMILASLILMAELIYIKGRGDL